MIKQTNYLYICLINFHKLLPYVLVGWEKLDNIKLFQTTCVHFIAFVTFYLRYLTASGYNLHLKNCEFFLSDEIRFIIIDIIRNISKYCHTQVLFCRYLDVKAIFIVFLYVNTFLQFSCLILRLKWKKSNMENKKKPSRLWKRTTARSKNLWQKAFSNSSWHTCFSSLKNRYL